MTGLGGTGRLADDLCCWLITSLTACLEAAQWRTRQLYRRHGYLPNGLFYLPDGGPPIFPMARPAQQRPAAAGMPYLAHQPGSPSRCPSNVQHRRPDHDRRRSYISYYIWPDDEWRRRYKAC